jgi:hypothetical protein
VKVTRGQVHEYLGMKLQYDEKGQVSIDMSEYVKHMLKGFPEEEVKHGSKTPWNENLFRVDAKSPELNGSAKELFHTVVAQGLFA